MNAFLIHGVLALIILTNASRRYALLGRMNTLASSLVSIATGSVVDVLFSTDINAGYS
jgi:hypothetical protein